MLLVVLTALVLVLVVVLRSGIPRLEPDEAVPVLSATETSADAFL